MGQPFFWLTPCLPIHRHFDDVYSPNVPMYTIFIHQLPLEDVAFFNSSHFHLHCKMGCEEELDHLFSYISYLWKILPYLIVLIFIFVIKWVVQRTWSICFCRSAIFGRFCLICFFSFSSSS